MRRKRNQWSRSLLIMGLLLLALISGFTLQIIYQLPDVNDLNTYMPSETTIIYSGDNKVLARMHNEENRQVVALSRYRLNNHVINRVIPSPIVKNTLV